MQPIDSIKPLTVTNSAPPVCHAEPVIPPDDFTAILLIVTAILLIFALTSRRHPLETQWRNFLTVTPINRRRVEAPHDSIMRTLGINGALGIIIGLLATTLLPNAPQVQLIIAGTSYALIKFLLHKGITKLFWNDATSQHWCHDYNLIAILEGVLITIATFFAMSGSMPTVYLFLSVGVVKLLVLYRLLRIFSRGLNSCLGIFLYFCTLEILAPALVYNYTQL